MKAKKLREALQQMGEEGVVQVALGQGVADAQRAVVGDADHVAGIGLVGDGAVLGKLTDAMKAKKLREALQQMGEEGVVQVFVPHDGAQSRGRRRTCRARSPCRH
jgi:peptide subunit release factor RF-3